MNRRYVTAVRRGRKALGEVSPGKLPPIAAKLVELFDRRAISRAFRRGQEIISEGRPCTSIFLILEGVALRYRVLRDGQRQVLNILIPGDFAGALNCRFEKSIHTVKALTPTVIGTFPLSTLAGLFDSNPQFGTQLLWALFSELAIMSEHLTVIGRRSAQERVAHLLLELFVRFQSIGLADGDSFLLPLTQEMIGDALGLSVPYVNRLLQQLREDGLVDVEDKVVTIKDINALSSVADFDHSYLMPIQLATLFADRGVPPRMPAATGTWTAQ